MVGPFLQHSYLSKVNLTSDTSVQALSGEPVKEGPAERVRVRLHVVDVGHGDDIVRPDPYRDEVEAVDAAIRSLQDY